MNRLREFYKMMRYFKHSHAQCLWKLLGLYAFNRSLEADQPRWRWGPVLHNRMRPCTRCRFYGVDHGGWSGGMPECFHPIAMATKVKPGTGLYTYWCRDNETLCGNRGRWFKRA